MSLFILLNARWYNINRDYSIWVKIIKFFAPYYEPKPKKNKKIKEKKTKRKISKKSKQKIKNDKTELEKESNETSNDEEINEEMNEENNETSNDEEINEENNETSNETSNDKANDKANEELNKESNEEVKEEFKHGLNHHEVETNKNKNINEDNNNKLKNNASKYSDKDNKNETFSNSKKTQSRSNAQKRRNEFDQPVMENLSNENPYISLAEEKMIMPVYNIEYQLDDIINHDIKPKLNQIWVYHDENHHQMFAHLGKGTGNVCKTRNDELRRNMTPWIRPRIKKKFDRTHVLPIGYHGSDGDPRLIIGWDSNHNQNELKNFEFKQKKRNENIFWLTDVRKTKYGAIWNYKIYSTSTNKLLDSLTLRMDKTQFMWRK